MANICGNCAQMAYFYTAHMKILQDQIVTLQLQLEEWKNKFESVQDAGTTYGSLP